MIVATAGHVDHGKTTLIKALTSVDTDRLPEEKRRGLTIEPGFAYWRLPDGAVIGFVDVPGHERFIRNMLGGVAGIDFALLAVAADDGPMPQTREHLAILDLLGLGRGAVALTKVDRVPPSRVAEVVDQTAALLRGSALARIPIFPCSALSGAGVADIARYVEQQARLLPQRVDNGHFRLAIDRCFNLAGAGLIVTGTVVSGSIGAGDMVRLLSSGREARVRSIHAQDTPAERGRAGQRCALNLVGSHLDPAHIALGDWIVAGEVPPAAARMDVRLRILTDTPGFTHRRAVHVHLATAHVTGRIAILDGSAMAAGGAGLAQLVLEQAIGAVRGDRFVVRDASGRFTLGGGVVIDVFPPARGRSRPARLDVLAAMEIEDDETALRTLLRRAPSGLALDAFAANRNLPREAAMALCRRVSLRRLQGRSGPIGIAHEHWQRLRNEVLEALADWHLRSPETVGPSADRVLAGRPGPGLPREAMLALVAELASENRVVRELTGVRLPTHKPRMRAADSALWQRIQPLLDQGRLRPPAVAQLATALGEEAPFVEMVLMRLAHHGLLVRVSKNRFFPLAAVEHLAGLLEEEVKSSSEITAAAFRDRSGLGRNLTIDVLEFFDRMGITRRSGDARILVTSGHGRDSHPGGAPGLQIR